MSSLFSKLDTDIITFHILPHLDGKTLIILSSVSSQFHNLICTSKNSKNLWRNICISTWPSLLAYPLTPFPETYFPGPNHFHSNVISTLPPSGYRTFFSDAFPSIHLPDDLNNIINPPPLTRFYYAVDIFLNGQPKPFSSLRAIQIIQTLDVEYKYKPVFIDLMGFRFGLIQFSHQLKDFNFIKVKKQGFEEYLKQNLTFGCVVIEANEIKRAGSLFTPGCKPVEVKPAAIPGKVNVVFETLMPSLSNIYTQMVKCRTKVECEWDGGAEDKFRVTCVSTTFEDMNGKLVWKRHAVIIILNAIVNGERKSNKQN